MSIIKTINPEYNFWELYPELKKIEEFSYLIKEYKKDASLVMWFIVLCFSLDSKYINIPIEERAEILSKDYLKDKNWYKNNSAKLESAIRMYEKLEDTPLRRHLRQWTETLEKRTKFLRETEYDLDNYDKLDKMAVGTTALLIAFDKIKAAMEKEAGEGVTKGGHIPSLSDEEEI